MTGIHQTLLSSAGINKITGQVTSVNNTTASTATTLTFTALPIGAADPSRLVVIAVACGSGFGTTPALTSITIGGVTATLVQSQAFQAGSVRMLAMLYRAAVPSGTSADVVFTWGTAPSGGYSFDLYSITNAVSQTPQDSIKSTDTTGVAVGSVIATVQQNFVIAVDNSNNTVGGTATWSVLTKNSDLLFGTRYGLTSASGQDITPGTISPSVTTTITDSAYCLAVWQ